jgi:two-component system C4-dicarboxylate transport response regulator DctD
MSHADPHTTCVQIPDGAALLIVDDDQFVRRALRRLLALEGTAVIEAADGEQALRVIEQDESHRLDVVLTNLLMPVVSGRELIAVLLQRRPTLPVVAMSALDALQHDLPPVPFLQKPFGSKELFETLAPLVHRSHARRQQIRQSRAEGVEPPMSAERRRDLMKALMQMRED